MKIIPLKENLDDPSTFDQIIAYFEITEPGGETTSPVPGFDLIVVIVIIVTFIGVIILFTGAVALRK
ncbi:MAG: hypothetical protein JW891_06285 [Candidatus Lokiarchaeota archaeon]|nr:hypothetical protein [Candidatus Lokiarchaeota archaeon]